MPRSRTRFALTLLAAIVGSDAAVADELPPPAVSLPAVSPASDTAQTFDYLVIRQDGAAFFEVLAADAGLRLDLSPKVNGILPGQRLTGGLDAVMLQATGDLGADWFAFNGVLYVTDRNEALTRLIRLGDLDPTKVVEVLKKSSLPTNRMSINPSADGSALALSGPPKLLALAEAMIEGIPPERVATAEPARTIRVRRAVDTETVRLP